MFIIILLLFSSMAASASTSITIDTSQADKGIVIVSSDEISKRTKVMVEKGTTKYYYDLKAGEEAFPLQLGQGQYKVTVLENTSGNKYKEIYSNSFKADISDEKTVYIQPMQLISWEEDMEAIKLANVLAQDEQEQAKIVQAIYDYIVNNIDYDYEKMDKLSTDYIPDIDTILKDGKGICFDYSVLFGAMLRSQGIPTKLIKGYRDGIKTYHAWNEVYIDGSWKIIDTTYSAWALKNGTSCSMFQEANMYDNAKVY